MEGGIFNECLAFVMANNVGLKEVLPMCMSENIFMIYC
jgi:hypothetical protein